MDAAQLTQLISALIIVESNGRDSAIGDGGLAVGPLQIHRGVVEDVNRLEGTSFTWKSMTNRVAARNGVRPLPPAIRRGQIARVRRPSMERWTKGADQARH